MRLLILFIILLCSQPLSAGMNISGTYESSLETQRDDGSYKWRMYSPWHRLDLRFYANPVDNTDIYLVTRADGDIFKSEVYKSHENAADDYERQDYVSLYEGHIRYKVGQKDNLETYFFARELRFWLGDPLLYLVSNDDDKWDWRNVAGVTTELNGGIKNFYLKCFTARLYNQNTDTFGIRAYQKFIPDLVHAGGTATYKNWHTTRESYNTVYSADTWLQFWGIQWTTEAAQSRTQFIETKFPETTTNMRQASAVKTEVRRDLDLNDFGAGDLSLTASVRDIGEDFRATLSKLYDNDRKYDQKGFYLESKYRVPLRAVTFTYHYDQYQRHVENFRETENYIESYMEFIKGFRWKNWYKVNHELNDDRIEVTYPDGKTEEIYIIDNTWQHILTQLEMENQLAYVKIQFKIKNIDTEYLKYLYGIEYSLKITKKLKSINRLVICDEDYRTRKSVFSQLQFLYWERTGLYLSYGNEYDTDNDLVNDDSDFVETNKDITHMVKLYLKADF